MVNNLFTGFLTLCLCLFYGLFVAFLVNFIQLRIRPFSKHFTLAKKTALEIKFDDSLPEFTKVLYIWLTFVNVLNQHHSSEKYHFIYFGNKLLVGGHFTSVYLIRQFIIEL